MVASNYLRWSSYSSSAMPAFLETSSSSRWATGLDWGEIEGCTVDGCQQLFALVLILQFGDGGLLGDIFQLTLGHLKLHLEAEGVKFPVGNGGVVVRLRGVVRQRLIGRRRGRVPLNESETERIIRNRGKSKTSHGESWRSLPLTRAGAAPFRLVGGAAPAIAACHGSWDCAGDLEKKALGWQRFEG
jgi:hypothetical protein